MIVQALDPSARALRYAAEHDAEGFLDGELRAPRAARLPAVRAAGPGGVLVAEPGPELRRPTAIASCVAAAGVPVSGRRRSSAARAATARSS